MTLSSISPFIRALSSGISIVAFLTVSHLCLQSLYFSESFVIDLKETRLGVAPPSDWARAIAFGQSESAALIDWLKILTQTDLVFPTEPGTTSGTGRHFLTQSELNPWFYPVYFDGAHLLVLLADDGISAETLLKKGIQQTSLIPINATEWKKEHWLPEENLWLLLLYTQTFETGDFEGASKTVKEVIKSPRLYVWYHLLEKKLQTTEGRFEIAIRIQEDTVRRYIDDEALRKKAETQLKNLITAYRYFKNHLPIPESLKIPKGLRNKI